MFCQVALQSDICNALDFSVRIEVRWSSVCEIEKATESHFVQATQQSTVAKARLTEEKFLLRVSQAVFRNSLDAFAD